jgi:hypothetical protein
LLGNLSLIGSSTPRPFWIKTMVVFSVTAGAIISATL